MLFHFLDCCQADPNNTGSIGALDAASFLKKSSLSDTTLSQVSPELKRSTLLTQCWGCTGII